MRTVFFLLITLSLTACRSYEEQQQATEASQLVLEKNLPAGCQLKYLGKLDIGGDVATKVPVVVVLCDNKQTTTINQNYQEGKTTKHSVAVQIGE